MNRSQGLASALIGAVLLTAGIVVAWVVGSMNGEPSPPLRSSSELIVRSSSRSGSAISLVDATGQARPCATGTHEMALGSVHSNLVLFADRGDIWMFDVERCGETPQIIATRRDLSLNRRAVLRCPSWSPDGRRAAAWVIHGTRSSVSESILVKDDPHGGWRSIDGARGCGWVDGDHVLAQFTDGADPVAWNVETAEFRFLEHPRVPIGTQFGRHAIYGVGGVHSDKADIALFDGMDGTERLLSQPALPSQCTPIDGFADGHLTPDRGSAGVLAAERFIAVNEQEVGIYDLHGERVGRLNVPEGTSAGWQDDDTFWLTLNDRLFLANLDGERIRVVLPRKGRVLAGAQSIISVRESRPKWLPRLVHPDSLEETQFDDIGIAFKVPPGWRVHDCEECMGPLSHPPDLVIGPSTTRGEVHCHGASYYWSFTMLDMTMEMALERFDQEFDFCVPHCLERKSVQFGEFRGIEIAFDFGDAGFKAVLVTHGTRTLLVEWAPDDVSVDVVLDGFRFLSR